MIRLGHIDYSNCIPVHALLLEHTPPDIEVVRDVPARLNAALASGAIDVAPCSSIEYARRQDEYRILPHHAIGSAGPVGSIQLESTVPLEGLGGRVVAVPTASATSVVLLRALLEVRLGVRPEYTWFEQAGGADPLSNGAAAALRIGDIALTHTPRADAGTWDLGEQWTAWTGLPFAFAVWQVRREVPAAAVRRLAGLLAASRAWFHDHEQRIALEASLRYGVSPERLLDYWRSLRYDLDPDMQRGLLHFYELAATLGEAPLTGTIDIVEIGPE